MTQLLCWLTGGAWVSYGYVCRSISRLYCSPSSRNAHGFRVARNKR